jgi:hypothetical protein
MSGVFHVMLRLERQGKSALLVSIKSLELWVEH